MVVSWDPGAARGNFLDIRAASQLFVEVVVRFMTQGDDLHTKQQNITEKKEDSEADKSDVCIFNI